MKVAFLSVASALVSVCIAATNAKFQRLGKMVPPDTGDEDFSVFEATEMSALTSGRPQATNGSTFFTQWLDHKNRTKGTFQQKLWWNAEFWGGPGSPIIFFTPGEIAAAAYIGYLTNQTLSGRLAQEMKGAVVMVEHRYWGDSSPYADLTVKNLQDLTLENSLADFVNLARTISLPFDTNHSSNADKAPWVFTGGSYSGNMAAWTESTSPGTFWAYHASSAPVEAIDDYWQYFTPIQDGMPKNCSKDVGLVVEYMDKVFKNGSAAEQLALKTKFGLADLEHGSDVMGVLENGPWLWQSNTFYTGYSGFFRFCDAVENVRGGAKITPDENGVGLEKALAGYANWVNQTWIPGYCQGFGYPGERDLGCMDTYNASNLLFTDRTVNNSIDRQWQWMLCNEPFSYWQDGAPAGRPTIVSRLVDAHYWRRQCDLFFPQEGEYTYGANKSPDNNVHKVNKWTKGWRLENSTRLIWTNGEFDPWRTASVSSEFRPGGPLASTEQHPVQIIPGGFHCSDLRLRNGQVNAGVQKVIDNQVAQLIKWVGEFPKGQ